MSVFSEVNDDATSIRADQVTFGPRLGFLGAFEASYEAQTRAASMFGIEKAWVDLEQEQIDNIRKAGGNPHKTLSGVDYSAFFRRNPWEGAADYMDAARMFVDGEDKGAQKVAEFDAQVDALRQQFPDLKLRTAREMFDEVRTRAQSAERTANQAPTTLMGDVGGFLGGAVGAFNLKTDPFNVITAPIGGSGKTAAGRVAGQVGAQGVIETINQVTGVQEERRLLGLDHGFAQGAAQVATTALGAGVLQGVGEGVAALGKRWFRSTPNDPAPPPPVRQEEAAPAPAQRYADTAQPVEPSPRAKDEARVQRLIDDPEEAVKVLHARSPLGTSRAAQARTVADVEHVAAELERWDGPAPVDVRPALPVEVRPGMSVDEIARRVDPDTFRLYDKYTRELEAAKAFDADAFARSMADAEARAASELDTATARVREAYARAAGEAVSDEESAKVVAHLKRRGAVAVLEGDADARSAVADMRMWADEADRVAGLLRDTPARKARDVASAEAAIAHLRPLVDRALAHASGVWKAGDANAGTRRRPTAPEVDGAVDAADATTKALAEKAKVLDAATEQVRESIERLLADTESGAITLEGYKRPVDLNDRITVPTDDGSVREVSVREYLEDIKRDNDELQSVATCSIKSRS